MLCGDFGSILVRMTDVTSPSVSVCVGMLDIVSVRVAWKLL